MKKTTLFLFLISILASCSSPAYLNKPKDFKTHTHGLIFKSDLGNGLKVLGEIIAVDSTSIVVLPFNVEDGPIISIPKKIIHNAEIIVSGVSDSSAGISALVTFINILPVAHGFFLVFTVPLNLITTIAISHNVANGTNYVHYPTNVKWEELYKFARFPQGMPDNIDNTQIK